ncbi:hypothetical protein BG004_007050 [Podila humilis]|nr:hypothetical protein BG004_007050 [Podila humilis]
MPWAIDPSIKIDRFDGRALLDFLPTETPAMLESGLRVDRNEDGLGDELRFERWFDLIEKERLHISEEQCLADIEEEWNDLVARHHALIGKTPEKKSESVTGAPSSFAFDYGTKVFQQQDLDHRAHYDGSNSSNNNNNNNNNNSSNQNQNTSETSTVGQWVDRELAPMEGENILDHLDKLTQEDKDRLDELGKVYSIQDYYRFLRIAKREQDERVRQLKITAVNLERAMVGKKPLKVSEISGLEPDQPRGGGGGRRSRREGRGRDRRRDRSFSPAYRTTRRSSPSYAPYDSESSRSGSESPKNDEKVEFISEFKADSNAEETSGEEDYGYHPETIPENTNERFSKKQAVLEPRKRTSITAVGSLSSSTSSSLWPNSPTKATASISASISAGSGGGSGGGGGGGGAAADMKMSLAEKLKQRMRQGLNQSIRLNEIKKHAKEGGDLGMQAKAGMSPKKGSADISISPQDNNHSNTGDPIKNGTMTEAPGATTTGQDLGIETEVGVRVGVGVEPSAVDLAAAGAGVVQDLGQGQGRGPGHRPFSRIVIDSLKGVKVGVRVGVETEVDQGIEDLKITIVIVIVTTKRTTTDETVIAREIIAAREVLDEEDEEDEGKTW